MQCILQEVEVEVLRLPEAIKEGLITSATTLMQPTWQWLIKILDVAQGQLEQGELFDTTVWGFQYRISVFICILHSLELRDVIEGKEPSAPRNVSAIFSWLIWWARPLRLIPGRLSHLLVEDPYCRATQLPASIRSYRVCILVSCCHTSFSAWCM